MEEFENAVENLEETEEKTTKLKKLVNNETLADDSREFAAILAQATEEIGAEYKQEVDEEIDRTADEGE